MHNDGSRHRVAAPTTPTISWLYIVYTGCKMQKLTKWGNSVGCRIPSALMESAGLAAGDWVRIRLRDDGTIQIIPKKCIPADAAGSSQTREVSAEQEATQW